MSYRERPSDELGGAILIVVFFLVCAGLFVGGSYTLSKMFPQWERSHGVRVGTIQKFSDSKGWVCKSGEGELVQSGFRTKTR